MAGADDSTVQLRHRRLPRLIRCPLFRSVSEETTMEMPTWQLIILGIIFLLFLAALTSMVWVIP